MSLSPEARARLHTRYIAGLPARLEVLLAVRTRLQAGDPEAIDEAQRLGHQFSGTGASFGFPELSLRGQALELAEDGQRAHALEQLIETVRATLQRQG